MQADGALKEKLEAYVQAQHVWANAFAQRQVLALLMGGGGAGEPDKATTEFAQMMQLLVAQQMGLDLSVPRGSANGPQQKQRTCSSQKPRFRVRTIEILISRIL